MVVGQGLEDMGVEKAAVVWREGLKGPRFFGVSPPETLSLLFEAPRPRRWGGRGSGKSEPCVARI